MEKRHRQLLSLVILGVVAGMVLHAVAMANLVNQTGPAEFIRDGGQGTTNTDTSPEKSGKHIMFV